MLKGEKVYLVDLVSGIYEPVSDSIIMHVASTPVGAINYALKNISELQRNDLYNITCEQVDMENVYGDDSFVCKVFPDKAMIIGSGYPEISELFAENVGLWEMRRDE